MKVYLAGPIDYAVAHHSASWQHVEIPPTVEAFCPGCNVKLDDRPFTIMDRNWSALFESDAVIGYFDGKTPTFGTPIEIYNSVLIVGKPTLLVHPLSPGVFVRHLAEAGMRVVPDFASAREWLSRLL